MNSREIAHAMGIAEGTVRIRIMRARQILKHKFLAPYASIDPLAGGAGVAAVVASSGG
jgi:predicted RNA polymerase sigma factor